MTDTNDRATSVLERTTSPVRHDDRRDDPVPRGWGSHDERRMMLLALVAFVALGLYATAFVLLGQVLST
jgi:hypothetical protein